MSKFILPIAELKPALAGLGKIISKTANLPVLRTVRVDRTKDGWITLTGTDLDAFVTVRLEEPSKGEPASVLVPYDDLAKTTKGCSPGETITVEQTSKDAVVLHYPVGQQTAQIKLESCAVEEFPPIPRIKGEPVPLNDDIRVSLLEAFDCASTDETRYILQGAFIDVSRKECHQIVATDGRHLYSSNSFSLPLKESVIIPTNKFLGWKEFNADGEWQLRMQPEEKGTRAYIQISSRRWRFIHRQIEGNYPNYRQVLPRDDQFNTSVQIEPAATKDLIQMIKRMPCDDEKDHRIGIRVAGRKVSFLSKADGKELEIEVPETSVKGKDVVVYLNRNFLTKALGFELCQLQIIDPLTPMRFSDGQGRRMIVMPVRPSEAPPNGTPPAGPAQASTPATPPVARESIETSAERSTMPKTSTPPTNGNGSNGHHAPEIQPVTLDAALDQIETIKGSYREAIRGLNTLTDTLKQVQRDQKTSVKEIQSVRSTLEKLQGLRI